MTNTNTPWFNNHQNLHTLAEWLRENRGWEFCKQNLLDVIETPWSWEKEWRLASGAVHFKLIERDETLRPSLSKVFDTDSTKCEWCEAQIGYVSYTDGGCRIVEWVTTYIDDNSYDLACDDCAGTAANFTETVPPPVVAS